MKNAMFLFSIVLKHIHFCTLLINCLFVFALQLLWLIAMDSFTNTKTKKLNNNTPIDQKTVAFETITDTNTNLIDSDNTDVTDNISDGNRIENNHDNTNRESGGGGVNYEERIELLKHYLHIMNK